MSETAYLGLRISQYIQNLKLEILQISGESRLLFAHRAKITYLIKFIQDLFKQLTISSNDQRIASSSEEIHFQQLMYILCDIRAIINNYITEQNFVQFVLTQSLDDVENSLLELKKEFIENFAELLDRDLKSIEVLFDNEEYNQCKFEDYSVLNQRLENLIPDSKTSINKKNELIDIIKERLSNCENLVPSDKIKKIYSEKEIKKILKSFQKYIINRDDYITLETKHYGSYSKVYTGMNKKTKKMVAIKVLNGLFPSEFEFDHFKEYLSFFISLNHPSILSFVGFSYNPLPLLSITNDMPGGTLSSRLHNKHKKLDPTKQTIIALGIARGMQFLHHKGFIYRDLSSSKILLDENDHPFISDFKIMSHKDKNKNGMKQITAWTAPELMIDGDYNQKVDVYSFGIILWEILTREVPFRGLSPFAIAHEVCESDSRPLIPQNCPPKLAKLIQVCWNKDPSKRPDFNAIVYSLESGRIAFLGTSSGPVISYSKLFKKIDEELSSEKIESSSGEPSSDSEDKNENTDQFSNDPIDDEFKFLDDDFIKNQKITEEAIKKYDDYSFDQIINIISTDPMSLVNLFSRDLKNSDIRKIITTKSFSKSLMRCIDICEWPDFLNDLASFFYRALNDKNFESYKDIFKNNPHLSIIMKLFKRFGSTHVANFVDIIDSLFDLENRFRFTFTLECFKSLAPFLISSEFEIRKKITSFLIKLFNQNAYDNPYSLIPIIPNLLENLKIEMIDDLLTISLKLCDSLCSIRAPLKFMIEVDAANIIVPLCLSSNDQVSNQAVHLINKILNQSQPSEKFIQNYLSKFANFHFDPSSSLALEPLVVLTHFLKTPEFVRLFIDNSEAIQTFSSYLESKDDTVLSFALRLTFSFISMSKTPSNFSCLCTKLINCLANKNRPISMMASACLTSIMPSLNESFDEKFWMTESLISYFKESLTISKSIVSGDEDEIKMRMCALKLAGALSMTFDGASFLHDNKIVELIIKFLNYRKFRFLALTVLASQSSQIPSSKALTNSTKTVIKLLKKFYKLINDKSESDTDEKSESTKEEEEEDYSYYSDDEENDNLDEEEMKIEIFKCKLLALNFIANVMVFPKAASITAHSIFDILKFADDSDIRIQQQTAKIIYAIVSAHETRDLVDYRDLISMIIKSLIPLLDSEITALDAYRTFEIISTLDFGSELLLKYIDVFKGKLAFLKPSMLERNPCVRIISRLSH